MPFSVRYITEFVRVNGRFRLEPVLVSNRAVPSLSTCKRAFSFTQMKTLYLPFLATTLFRPEFLHRPDFLCLYRRGSRILKWGVNFCNNVIFYRAKAWLRCLRSVQRRALKELINVNNKEIILKKADKGRTTVVMNGENKINDGQKQLDDRNNCQPLDEPMVRDTSQRVKHLINALHQAGCIDEMTVKWFNLTPNPPRSPVFYTLTKIHKPTLVGSQDLSYLGVMAQQNAYHHS